MKLNFLARPGGAVDSFIGLGANLGDAQQTVLAAAQQLRELPYTQSLQLSSLYRSAPIESSGAPYINAVARLQTGLTAPDLLAALLAIERIHGRQRPYLNAPRTLDLDLLLYGGASVQSPALTVPHPRLWQRAFVLLPLAEIAPELVTPAQLLAVQDQEIARLP